MDSITACTRYIDAWNRHDVHAIFATFAHGATYRDPTTPGPISGDALRRHVGSLWAAFPDLAFQTGLVHRVGDARVHAEWAMTGTNTGPLNGLPPTDKVVRLDGVDVFDVGTHGIRSVRGFFDSADLPRQLGLEVIVQPKQIGGRVKGQRAAVVWRMAGLPVPTRYDQQDGLVVPACR
jgi:steroid delta-isomerase-like uncharacterized protein